MSGRLERFRDWWEETHSAGFELRRHFFRSFFDSELVSSPGQWRVVAIGAVGIVASLAIILSQTYFRKYRLLGELDSPEPYRLALISDHLFFITLAMLLIGLLTALLWSSLFPGLRDYLAFTGLPLRPRDIFAAKLAALLAFAGAFIVFTNALPSLTMAGVSQGRYEQSVGWSMITLFLSSSLAALFIFFVLVALQGVLLNIVPMSWLASVSLFVQGGLLTIMLCGLPFVLTIPGLAPHMTSRPEYAMWLPPVWFLAVDQLLLGNQERYVSRLAGMALVALTLAAVATAAAYVWSYRRHRIRVIESPVQARQELEWFTRWRARIADWIIPIPQEQAVFGFVVKTLPRSQQHRLVLTAFGGIAVAVILNVFVTMALEAGFHGFGVRTLTLRQAAVCVPQALSLFLLAGFQYLFRLPVELRANWIFQVNEGGHRLIFLRAVERFLRWAVVAPVALVTLPALIGLLGAFAGIGSAILSLFASLLLVEFMLFPLDRIPFTSSYLPGQRPLTEVLIRYVVGVGLYVYAVSAMIVWATGEPEYFVMLFGVLLAAYAHFRKAREESWQIGKLEFVEILEPVVHSLNIDKD